MTILLIEGDIGTGKTLLATILSQMFTSYEHVYANYNIKDKRFELFDIDMFFLGKYRNSLIIIDEAYTIADSRQSFNKDNLDFSIAAFQSRKMKSDIIYTCQIRGSIDIRLRDSLTYLVSCNLEDSMFHYTLFQKKRFGDNMIFEQINEYYVDFENAKKFFKYYDTYEIVSTNKQKNMEISKEKVEEIKQALKLQKHKTKDFIRFFLMKEYRIYDSNLVSELYYNPAK